jgi:hypothetical protein
MVNTLTVSQYVEMWGSISKWQQENHTTRLPNYVIEAGFKIWKTQFLDMLKRMKAYMDSHGQQMANIIGIEGPAPHTGNVSPVVIGIGPIQTVVQAVIGSFSTITEFCNKMRGRGYGAYMNDQKSLATESKMLALLNCVDATQLLQHLSAEMGGYEFKYAHVYCLKSGEGHVYAEMRGRELGSTWKKIDLAAMMSKTTLAQMFHGWCFDAKPIYNEAWLTAADDGKM